MKASKEDSHCSKKLQNLRKQADSKAHFTSAHLLFIAFLIMMAFGGIMKLINHH